MLIFAIFIIVLLTIYMIMNYRQKFSYVYALYFIGIVFLILYSEIYRSKLSGTVYINKLDELLYHRLVRRKIGTDSLLMLFNSAIMLLMLAEIFAINAYRRIKPYVNILLSIPAALSFIWMHPNVALKVYIQTHKDMSVLTQDTVEMINFGVIIIFIAYMAVAFLALADSWRVSKISRRKREILMNLIFTALLDFYILQSDFVQTLKNVLFGNINLFKYEVMNYSPYARVGMTCFLLITLIFIILSTLFSDRMLTVVKSDVIDGGDNMLGENFAIKLHSYKNAFLGIKKYIEMSEMTDNSEIIAENNRQIFKICNDGIEKLQKEIRGLMATENMKKYTDLSECAKKAIEELNKPADIEVTLEEAATGCFIRAEFDGMLEAILNVLYNAVDALETLDGCKKINISVGRECRYCYISITDNAGGLKKSDIRKVILPYFTTKPLNENSGIGLYYVKKFVNNCGGDVVITVKPHKFTAVQLVFEYKSEVFNGKNQYSNM